MKHRTLITIIEMAWDVARKRAGMTPVQAANHMILQRIQTCGPETRADHTRDINKRRRPGSVDLTFQWNGSSPEYISSMGNTSWHIAFEGPEIQLLEVLMVEGFAGLTDKGLALVICGSRFRTEESNGKQWTGAPEILEWLEAQHAAGTLRVDKRLGGQRVSDW